MKVELTDISQGVSVSDPGVNVNRLHFKTDEGKTFSVPISPEALDALLRELYGEVKEAAVDESGDLAAPEGATQFGGLTEQEEDEILPPPDEEEDERQVPQTEDEVPSL